MADGPGGAAGPAGTGGTPGRETAAEAQLLARYAGELADAVEEAIPRWVDRSVRRALAAQGLAVDDAVGDHLGRAARAAREEGGPRVRALLGTDVDRQRSTPLAILRDLVRYPTQVLRAAGARPVARDEFSERSFPGDAYDLTPASFADVDPGLHELGMAWGAAKAYVHKARHRPRS